MTAICPWLERCRSPLILAGTTAERPFNMQVYLFMPFLKGRNPAGITRDATRFTPWSEVVPKRLGYSLLTCPFDKWCRSYLVLGSRVANNWVGDFSRFVRSSPDESSLEAVLEQFCKCRPFLDWVKSFAKICRALTRSGIRVRLLVHAHITSYLRSGSNTAEEHSESWGGVIRWWK